MVKVGLINNRHPMPVQNYIFEKEIELAFTPVKMSLYVILQVCRL